MHYAAYWGYPAIAKRLLEGGADVTLRDRASRTALDFAREDLSLRDKRGETAISGKTAIDIARKHGKSEVVALLKEPR